MNRLIGLFAFLVMSAAPAMAQDYSRFDLSAGASFRGFQQSEKAPESLIGMPGWYFSADYNIHGFHNLLGAEIQAMGDYRQQGYFGQTSVYTFLVGPRIYPVGHHKLTPYGHVLFGGGYYRNYVPPEAGGLATTFTYGSKAWEAGGGLDLNIRKHWGVRLLEFNFGQTGFFNYKITQTNYVAAVGINYRFGGK
jgi:hypothetical protein